MAVPATGTLSMQDIAQERLNSTYGSGNVTGPISMYNLVNGGNTGGAVTSGNTYPAVNTGCDPNPASRSSYVTFLQVGKYVNNSLVSTHTFYLNPSQAATVQDLAEGDTVYSDADLTTAAPAHGDGSGSYYMQTQTGLSNDDRSCNNDNSFGVDFGLNSSGVVDIYCGCGGC